tara:strand:- start:270 stop:1475 length:1206 start_codon:yes stop_codon:yes gene_type:complete
MIETKILTLIEQGTDIVFKQNNITGNFVLQNAEQVAMIKLFESGELAELVIFRTTAITFKVGSNIDFSLTINNWVGHYASYQSYIEHALNSNDTDHTPIVYEDKIGVNSLLPSLKLIYNFIYCLKKHYYYQNNQIVIFAQTHCEITIQVRATEKYLQIAKSYQESEQLFNTVKNLTDWLNADISDDNDEVKKSLQVHETERNTIVAVELLEKLSNQEKDKRIFFLLENVLSIYQSILSRYSLYLEDFKFSKFNDKVAEHAEKFLEKTNDIIIGLQNQILAIPVAVALISITKADSSINGFLVASFMIYCWMVLYATSQQIYNLWHLRCQTKNFAINNEIPREIKDKWDKEIMPVNNKIIFHAIYLFIVALLLILIILNCFSYFHTWNSWYIFNLLPTALSS